MTIYERIKARRKELELSADTVADALGVSRATVYRYESQDIEKLPTTVLESLSKVLCCSPGYLMGWEDSPNITYKQDFPLSDLEKDIIRKFRNLSNGERAMFLRTIGIEDTEKEEDAKMA